MLEEFRSAKKVVGIKQSIKAVERGEAKVALIAKDADERIINDFREKCAKNSVEVIYVDTMKQLGKMCSIEVGAAAAVVLKYEV